MWIIIPFGIVRPIYRGLASIALGRFNSVEFAQDAIYGGYETDRVNLMQDQLRRALWFQGTFTAFACVTGASEIASAQFAPKSDFANGIHFVSVMGVLLCVLMALPAFVVGVSTAILGIRVLRFPRDIRGTYSAICVFTFVLGLGLLPLLFLRSRASRIALELQNAPPTTAATTRPVDKSFWERPAKTLNVVSSASSLRLTPTVPPPKQTPQD